MKEPSIKELILAYLKANGGWVFGGVIEDYIRSLVGSKASNASRRARELAEEGKLWRQTVSVEGLRVVQYKFKPKEEQRVQPFVAF